MLCRALLAGLGALFAVPVAVAHADGLQLDAGGARAVGRAGAVTVSDDGGGALLTNPGGLARRESWRFQLGVTVHDSDSAFVSADGGPRIESRGAPDTAPRVAVIGGVGPVVVGAAYLDGGGRTLVLPAPQFAQPADDVNRLFPHRYGGTRLGYRRRTLVAGASLRASSWLGVGVSVAAVQTRLEESRRLWAGFTGRGDVVGDASRDIALTVVGRDNLAGAVSLGALIAPPELPVEFALSASYATPARLTGSVTVAATRGPDEAPPVPAVAEATSSARLPEPLWVRAGARYLGGRFTLEACGELALLLGDPPVWRTGGISVRDASGAIAELGQVPSLVDRRTYGAARIAADVELVPGFLWLLGGYAYRVGASASGRLLPGYADLDRHTAALGAEAQWNGFTVTVGYSRTLGSAVTQNDGEVELVNPFDGGTTTIGQGTYDAAGDAFGVALERAWE